MIVNTLVSQRWSRNLDRPVLGGRKASVIPRAYSEPADPPWVEGLPEPPMVPIVLGEAFLVLRPIVLQSTGG
jgi:hypothetical protein